jgi:hypothetical protein
MTETSRVRFGQGVFVVLVALSDGVVVRRTGEQQECNGTRHSGFIGVRPEESKEQQHSRPLKARV